MSIKCPICGEITPPKQPTHRITYKEFTKEGSKITGEITVCQNCGSRHRKLVEVI